MKALTLLLFLTASAWSQVLIYEGTGRLVTSGQGARLVTPARNFLAYSLNPKEAVSCGAFVLNGEKKYVVSPLDGYVFRDNVADKTGSTTIIAIARMESPVSSAIDFESIIIKGRNQRIVLGTLSFTAPARLAITSNLLLDQGNHFLGTGTGTYTLNRRKTSVSMSLSLDQIVANWESEQISKGYSRGN